jgi:putative alpha-1,2-mannosidase
MRLFAIVTVFLFLCYINVYSQPQSLTDYVNPLIGSALKGEGGTAPFVGPPFAMTNFLAQTRENKMGKMAYVYEDSHIMGFML